MKILKEKELNITAKELFDEIVRNKTSNITERRKIKQINITDSLNSFNLRDLTELISNMGMMFPLSNYTIRCSYDLFNTIISINANSRLTGLTLKITNDIPKAFETPSLDNLNFKVVFPLNIAFILPPEIINLLANYDDLVYVDNTHISLFMPKYNELRLKCERIKQDINYNNISNKDEVLKDWLKKHVDVHKNDANAKVLAIIIYNIISRSNMAIVKK